MGFVYTVQGSLPGIPPPPSPTQARSTLITRFSVVSLECLATLAQGELRGEGLSQGAFPPHRYPAPYLTLVPRSLGCLTFLSVVLFISVSFCPYPSDPKPFQSFHMTIIW